MNTEMLKKLHTAYEFLHIKMSYRNLSQRFHRDIEGCEETYRRIKNEKFSAAPLYIAMLFAAVVLFMLAGLISSQVESGTPVFVVAVLVVGAIVAANRFIKTKKREPEIKAAEFWEKTGSPTIIEDRENIEKINAEMQKFTDENEHVLDFLPEDYKGDIDLIAYAIHLIKNDLADSMKEVIHLYNEELHRAEMQRSVENMQRAMDRHHSEMESYMEESIRQQQITNSTLQGIETLEFLNYVYNK